MNELNKVGYISKEYATGAVAWCKDDKTAFMICDWATPSGETHEVVFYGDEEDIHIDQAVILALARVIKASKKIKG